ncbi:MAG: hypothetical protein JNK79_07570 [Chitinophagaceae bacterium]|nr:hypothetical protein [Chitinophagaceae bacterium]
MKTIQWPLRAFLFVVLLQTASCTKNVDAISDETASAQTSSNLTFPTTNEFATCKLRRIYQHTVGGGTTITAVFTYDHRGNPVSVLYESTDVIWPNDHYFSYDRQGRLSKYVSTGQGDFTHTYAYDANNRIIRDTTFIGPPNSPTTFYVFVSTLTYDSQGRIIKENIRNIATGTDDSGNQLPLLPTRNPTYTYDARGNLAVKGWKSSSYDNKVSIFRTHPVFQFIHRNYSMNSPAPQAKYNSRGLPLSMNPTNDAFFNTNYEGIDAYPVTRAIYDCD